MHSKIISFKYPGEVVATSIQAGIFDVSVGQLLECRGATWRFLGQTSGFWHLELLKEGAQFTENPIRVWALPHLEANSIRLLDTAAALAPAPTMEQRAKGKFYKPYMHARQNHSLQDTDTSSTPQTALHCAIDHKPWQFEPWRRMVNELSFPRILIADDVGLGKTTEAAIILAELTRRRRAARVLIITPQHLTEKWQDELYERFGLPFEIYHRETRARLSDRGVKNPWEIVERVIVSRDFVKRWENLKALEKVQWDVVVIDECHHFVQDKNQSPTRLRELAEKIVYNSPGLIMLSATPFTGSTAEFHSLLRLLDPKFHATGCAESWDPKNPHLIRRLKGNVKEQGETIFDRKISNITVTENDLDKVEASVLSEVAAALADSKSASDAQSWDRLLEETARKRLSSSWEAFLDTVNGSERISTWLSDSVKSKIRTLCEKQSSGKLRALRNTLADIHSKDRRAKVVIFTEAIATQEGIADFLTKSGGYANSQVSVIRANTPRDERLDIEDQFANPDSELLVLIATDTISEGKDLQHACHHLIHFELPWSLVKIEQRNGRIDRLGQTKPPHIYNLVFDTKATPDQNVLNRLLQKLERAKDALGSVSPIIAAFENLKAEDLLENDADAKLTQEIATATANAQEFGFDLKSLTTLSSAPIIDDDDVDFRRQNMKIALETLGGQLEPYGKTGDQFSLGLPDGPAWDIPAIASMAEPYPSLENPWRVTFNPRTFLDYESYRRKHGEGREPLRFISPVHPITQQIDFRFRSRLSEQGYPVFSVDNAAHDVVVVAELSARSPSSRLLAQKMVAIELKNYSQVPLDVLNAELKGLDAPPDLPSVKTWREINTKLSDVARAYVDKLGQEYNQRKATLTEEQSTIPSDAPGASAREAWIHDLWTVDETQAQFQIIALLVAKR